MSSRREGCFLALAAFALAAAFTFLPGPLYYEDAQRLVPELYAAEFTDFQVGRHRLILPFARILQRTAGLPPEDALGLLSALSAAALPAFTYLALRRFGFAPGASAFGAALLGLAPTTVFYGRHIEVHAPNAAATALAFAVACRTRPSRRPLGDAAGILGAFAATAGTHAGGILSCPFLAWFGAGRSDGVRRKLFLGLALSTGLFCAAGGLALLGVLTGVFTPERGQPLYPITVTFSSGRWDFSPLRILEYAGATVVPHGAFLLGVGLPGLLLLARSDRRSALVFLAWFLAYLIPYGAWGFQKLGGYLLPTYPALALGAAHALSFLAVRRAALARALVVLALAGQGFLGVRTAVADLHEPHPLAWARSLRAATGDEGLLVTDWIAHRTTASLHSRLTVATVGTLAYLPVEDRPAGIARFADYLDGRIGAGQKVFVDADLEGWVERQPALGPLLATLRERFAIVPVGDGVFRGWKLERR